MGLAAGLRECRRLLGAGVLVGIASACLAADQNGTLVIAGGAVSADNAAIYEAFVGAMPDPDEDYVAVISAASGEPVGSMQRVRETLARYGISAERVHHVRLAVMDDEDTADVDERTWAGNGHDPAEIAKIETAGGVWISGGDQLRIAKTLLGADGTPTPMLEAMRQRLAAGAVIGGTSAGAAIMSDPMIARGLSIAALLHDENAGEPLQLSMGLGFFPHGLVDQHFDANARLGRMAVALGRLDSERRIGFGIDEDTALVHALTDNSLTVAGAGNVTVIDGRRATWRTSVDGVEVRGLRVSVLSPGDRLGSDGVVLTPADYLAPTIGSEYHDYEPIVGSGIALPSRGLAELLGRELLDNVGATTSEHLTFAVIDGAARGFRFRFRQTQESRGYWGYDAEGRSRYSVDRVRLDIEPVRLRLEAR
jgi:cyanophycinase